MNYTDHHVHTSWSPDSSADAARYIRRAKALGLDFIMFTDHVDFGSTDPDFLRKPDYRAYFRQMRELSERHEFPIQVGVEIGYEKNQKRQIEAFLDSYPFDFVIASLHYGDGKDFYRGDFFDGKTQQEAYLRYFELVLEMAENFTQFDAAGHLDYITRYGPFENRQYDPERYSPVIDAILKALIRNRRGLEVNTSGLRGAIPRLFPMSEVLVRYRELGGTVITVGSDSHFNDHYYAGIEQAMAVLRELNFSTISSFTGRRETRLDLVR